jgi:hypothetical protein
MLVFACASAALAVIALAALVVDHRMLDGAPVWVKPLKFGVSGLVYGVTWAWLCSLTDRGRRAVRWASLVVVIPLGLELILITGQAARGRRSHFNFDSTFDGVVYLIMATSIFVVWCGGLVLTVLAARSRIGDRPARLTVGLGAVISLCGIGLGALMTIPSGGQITSLTTGHGFDSLGAHTVGAPDGGPGLPLLGWSTTAGDLRIPHFVGMHALQALLAWHLLLGVLARRWERLRPAAIRARLVCVAAAGFSGLVVLLTWQAYRGQPLLGPDGWTLAALAVLAAGVVVAGVLSVRHGPRDTRTPTRIAATPASDSSGTASSSTRKPSPSDAIGMR